MSAALHLVSTHRGPIPHTDLDIEPPPPTRRAAVREEPLPTTGAYPPLWAVMGAHGGAGATTLARWWAPAADAGLSWPGSARTTQRVIIVARVCMAGMIAAADRLREWHAGLAPDGVVVIGLVLMPLRPGRVPAPVRRYRATVTELAECVYDIGWHDHLALEPHELAQFRPGDPPPPRRRASLRAAVPADVGRAGADIVDRLAHSRKSSAQQHISESPS
ncbi:hypothetical protein [Nocardia puris]|uniref:Uncharacterized protein n=1 Tax=Nocardia puris TaxID=208602 RepID=A0A366D5M8_9NOCA|nr:hypothetical protein [Nocardia puris]RBO85332.1 hypothetical protein DFR74_115180 [Nocardia puris]